MTTWHAPPDTLARFARSPESLDDVTAYKGPEARAAANDAGTFQFLDATPAGCGRQADDRTDLLQRLARVVEQHAQDFHVAAVERWFFGRFASGPNNFRHENVFRRKKQSLFCGRWQIISS